MLSAPTARDTRIKKKYPPIDVEEGFDARQRRRRACNHIVLFVYGEKNERKGSGTRAHAEGVWGGGGMVGG